MASSNVRPLRAVSPAKENRRAKSRRAVDRLSADQAGQLAAINRSQAVIEFSLDGTVLDANENFLKTLGYTLEEIKGRHHSLFVDPADVQSTAYRAFWEKLGRGEFDAGEYKRIGKGGKEVWIQASYNPILDGNGRPLKVIKYATDITAAKLRTADFAGQLAAINKAQAVIEFKLDGTVLHANENFLKTLGYTLEEITGKHHSLFVENSQAHSAEYRAFWERLGRGQYDAGEYKRIGKGGKEVWIQASYNPILDMNNRPFKVVKYATDITEAKLRAADFAGQLAAINKAQAVIEFKMDGTVVHANENFLKTLDYSLDEIKGKHHSMFAEPEYAKSPEYRGFWERLGRGEYDAGVYKRIGKGGKEVWIQASYNPILDMNGKPFKVVKYATDVTEQVKLREHMATVLKAVATSAQELTTASTDLSAISQQMSANAEETATQSNTVSAAAEQVSANVQTVAAGTEEMSASIREIARNAADAAKVAREAVSIATATNSLVIKLGESSNEVGNVIKVITSIAQQTKLLALNATIEAARAGEAGKGFAVVANEVKELAKETAKATEDISRKIEAIQGDTRGAVTAIGQISTTINQINDIQTTIASAVEEQTATTNEMTRNVSEGAKGTNEIARNISEVATAAQDTTKGAAKSLQAARVLTEIAAQLKKLVEA